MNKLDLQPKSNDAFVSIQNSLASRASDNSMMEVSKSRVDLF